jgi:L-fuconolactonase
MSLVIDAHHHLLDPARFDYPWLTPDLAAIDRRFGPEDFAPELAAAGIDHTILVQTISSIEETRDFLEIAARTPFIAGVIGWIDLTDPDAAAVIDLLRAGPGGDRLVGIRHQVHDEPDPVAAADRCRPRAGGRGGSVAHLRPAGPSARAAGGLTSRGARAQARHRPPRQATDPSGDSSLATCSSIPEKSGVVQGLRTRHGADWTTWSRGLAPLSSAIEIFRAITAHLRIGWPVCLLAASMRRGRHAGTQFACAAEREASSVERPRRATPVGSAGRVDGSAASQCRSAMGRHALGRGADLQQRDAGRARAVAPGWRLGPHANGCAFIVCSSSMA